MQHAKLLADHGMPHLDIAELRCRDRVISQTLSRFVYDQGGSGILYRSDLDDLRCVALFDGRARLIEGGSREPLTERPTELLDVCNEFALRMP